MREEEEEGGRSIDEGMERCGEERRNGDCYRWAVLPIDLR